MDGIILDDVKKVIGFVSDYTELQLSKRRLSEKYSSAITYINILLRGKTFSIV